MARRWSIQASVRRVDNFVMRKLLMQEEFSDAAGDQSAGGCPLASDVLT